MERLQSQGHTVVAPPNPLRGLADDTAYIASVVDHRGRRLAPDHGSQPDAVTNVILEAARAGAAG